MKHCAMIVAFMFLMCASAAGDAGLRYVYSFTGADSNYSIRHGAFVKPPYYGLRLETGDCVDVLRRTNELPTDNESRIVVMVDGRLVTLRKGDTPYCLRAPAGHTDRFAIIVANMFAQFGPYFDNAQRDFINERTAPAISRGGDDTPAIPLVNGGTSKLGAGRRALELGWTGGRPPFHIEVNSDRTPETVTERRSVESRGTRLPEAVFVPGRYLVRVTDYYDQSDQRWFVVVPTANVPRPGLDEERALRDDKIPRDVRSAVDAAFIAAHGADWKLEALQRASAMDPRSDLRKALMLELVAG